MTDKNIPVTEDELHAYIDNELPAERRGDVGIARQRPRVAAQRRYHGFDIIAKRGHASWS